MTNKLTAIGKQRLEQFRAQGYAYEPIAAFDSLKDLGTGAQTAGYLVKTGEPTQILWTDGATETLPEQLSLEDDDYFHF